MRSVWKGSISFGLVHIPVRLYTATEDRRIHFRQLHEACGTPIRYRRWCEHCRVMLEAEDITRAYEWGPDQWIPIEDEDLEDLPVPTQRTVEIREFTRLETVDPVYFDRTYYLEPAEGGSRAYQLLREAMRRTGRVAIGKVALRSKESLACLRVFGERALAMETMYYPDEIRPVESLNGLEPAQGFPDEKELELAVDLIERLAGSFRPEEYEDAYRIALLERIEAKAQGKEFPVMPVRSEPAAVDLMEALRASLERSGVPREDETENGKVAQGERRPAGKT